ncbi:MAG: amidohydrolase family protein [Caldilineaceae bacterium]
MDLIIRNARLMDGSQVDIGIKATKIAALENKLATHGAQEIDASGSLTLPAFVNGQLHACKSFWRRRLAEQPVGVQSLPRFQAASYVKAAYSEDDVFERVDETMRLAIQHGTCAIRLFGDVDEANGLTAVRALLRIRQKYQPWLSVQVVAFPQDGVAGARTEALMHQALSLGADVVGGIPWIESSDGAQQAHTDLCFALAKQYDKPLHFVCDDTANPASRTLEMVARQTLRTSWYGRVSATQCAALSFYEDDYANSVISLVREAAITIFSNSHVALIATDFDTHLHPWPRSITRVRQLLDAGVAVACGQDDIDNWFYPFGRNDMLEVAHFMAHNGQFAWQGEVNRVLPMITTTPAGVLGLIHYGLEVGKEANLVILNAQDWHSALQFQAEKQAVILRGKLAAETTRETRILIR